MVHFIQDSNENDAKRKITNFTLRQVKDLPAIPTFAENQTSEDLSSTLDAIIADYNIVLQESMIDIASHPKTINKSDFKSLLKNIDKAIRQAQLTIFKFLNRSSISHLFNKINTLKSLKQHYEAERQNYIATNPRNVAFESFSGLYDINIRNRLEVLILELNNGISLIPNQNLSGSGRFPPKPRSTLATNNRVVIFPNRYL